MIAVGIMIVVWIANRISRKSNTTNPNAKPGNPRPPRPNPPQPQHVNQQPPVAQPCTPIAKPNRLSSYGCLIVSLGLGGVLLLCVMIIGTVLFGFYYNEAAQDEERQIASTVTMVEPLEGPSVPVAEAIPDKEITEPNVVPELNPLPTPNIAPSQEFTYVPDETYYGEAPVIYNMALPILAGLLLMMVLVIVTIIVTRTLYKTRQSKTRYSNSDSTINPPAQKMGVLPWVIVSMVLVVPLVLVFGLLLWTCTGVAVHDFNSNQQHESRKISAAPADVRLVTSEDERPGAIPVPIEPFETNSVEAPSDPPSKTVEATTEEPSFEDLNAELEGSNASLILESVFRAAMKSVQKKRSPTEVPTFDKTVPEAKLVNSKPSNAIQSFFKGLMPKLPKNVSQNDAFKSLGELMGEMIAAKNGRPEWLDQPSGFDPQTGIYRTVVTVGPYDTAQECTRHLNDSIRKAVDEYIEMHLDLGPAARGRIALSNRQLNELIKHTDDETFMSSFGPMVNLHVELVFDHKMQDLLKDKFHKSLIYDRIEWSGLALGSIALFLLGALAILKFDPLYRRRILIAAGIGTVILIGLGLLLIV